jgi:hypothetical protein
VKFTVVEATVTKEVPDGKFGPMKSVTLGLVDEAGAAVQAEWFTKAETPLPQPGSSLEGDLENGPYGKKFKKAAGQFAGGGGFRQKDPAERRSIAMQSSGARGTDIVCALISSGAWKPDSADDAAKAALRIAHQFYAAVQKAEAGS